jgi:hypothetical protein
MVKINRIWTLLILVALACFIVFFPIRTMAGHTCFADYLTSHGPVSGPHPLSFGAMRARYVFPFGLIWWASIGILFWGLIKLQQKQ